MAPAPSPNACGLAAYRQLAGNLRIDDIDHRYWTSRKGNALRYALWAERRRHAAPYLREIAEHFDKAAAARLRNAAAAFEAEAEVLGRLTAMLPEGGDEKAHWDEANIAKAEALLAEAGALYQNGIVNLREAVGVDLTLPRDADALEKLVVEGDVLEAEAALGALVDLAPKDLDLRLARLIDTEPDEKKDLADGPIHRHILFALAKLPSDAATAAIGRAISFPGKSDAVPPAVSNWAAEIYWERKGKDGRDVFVGCLESGVPHAVDNGIKYLGLIGDASVLPLLAKFESPAAYQARIRLGDGKAWPLLIAGIGTPDWFPSYSRLRELGAACEPHVLPYLETAKPPMVVYAAALLSRVGTEKSLEPLERTVAKYPTIPRIAQALEDLKKKLAE